MLKVYQFNLTREEGDLVNAEGWHATPKTEAYAGKFRGYQKGTFKYFKHVANVKTNDLEHSFHLMNLWEEPDLIEQVEDRCASMSVGDVVETEKGEFFAVADIGFDKINLTEEDYA